MLQSTRPFPRRQNDRSAFPGALTRSSVIRTLSLVLTLLVILPAPGLAHGALQRAAPGDGDHLSTAPRELRLTFTEDVELAFARLALTGPSGAVELGELRVAPDSTRVLVGQIRGLLVAGTYTVQWQVAGDDGHPVRGSYSFTVAAGARGLAADPAGPTAPGQIPPPVVHHEATTFPGGPGFDAESRLYVAVRWLTFLGLLGVLGVIAFRLILWLVQRQEPSFVPGLVIPASSHAARLGIWMAVLVGAAALLRLYAQSYALHGAAETLNPERIGTMLARTIWGWGWLLQAGGTLVVLAGFAWVVRRSSRALAPAHAVTAERVEVLRPVPENGEFQPSYDAVPGAESATAESFRDSLPERVTYVTATSAGPEYARASGGWALAALGAVALAFTPGMSGHAASTPQLAPLPILTDGLHVIGAGGWLGSLLVLLVVGIPVALRLGALERGPAVATLVNAFSPTALFFAGTVIATGVFAAWLHLGTVPALWESRYGQVLLLKLAVLSVVLGTGAYNWLRVKPALGDEVAAGRLRRSATLELVVGAVVLAVTAVLVATATPGGIAPPP
jgi:putative copper export protein/methionine-rich copper-binding protein CopC